MRLFAFMDYETPQQRIEQLLKEVHKFLESDNGAGDKLRKQAANLLHSRLQQAFWLTLH